MAQFQHYAGVAWDIGQNLDYVERLNLRNTAANSGVWLYVELIELTPRWVHFDDGRVVSGYSLIRLGSRENYVCIAQDTLINLGYDTGGLDGIFGDKTYDSVRNYQRRKGLLVDGIIGNNTWKVLMKEVVGMGKNNNTIN